MTATKDNIIDSAAASAKDRRGRTVMFAMFGVGLLSAVITAVILLLAYMAMTDTARDGQNLATQVQADCADPGGELDPSSPLCTKSEEVIDQAPSAVKGDKGEPGQPGNDGPPPSSAQVLNAVALYCSDNPCRGSRGENATATQVANAVARFCNARGECRGPGGLEGPEGPGGPSGDQGDTGPQGPGPTGEQVAAAVTEYCASRNDCRGPRGEQGPTGVVNVDLDCDAPDGQVFDRIVAVYNESTRTITAECTYKDDDSFLPPAPPNPEPTQEQQP